MTVARGCLYGAPSDKTAFVRKDDDKITKAVMKNGEFPVDPQPAAADVLMLH